MDKLDLIIVIIVGVVSWYLIKLYYKKCETLFEKVFYILLISLEMFVMLLYYFDRFNIPTNLGWNENINLQNWFNILSNCGITIFAEILSGVILFFVTLKQIERTEELNDSSLKNDRRINNMPVFKYDINNGIGESSIKIPSIYDGKNSKNCIVSLKAENVGMNTAKKCYLKVQSEIFEKENCFKFGKQSMISRGESKNLSFECKMPTGNYSFKFIVYYQDLLNNWYMQDIELNLEFKSNEASIINYIVNDEALLEKEPILNI